MVSQDQIRSRIDRRMRDFSLIHRDQSRDVVNTPMHGNNDNVSRRSYLGYIVNHCRQVVFVSQGDNFRW